MAEVRKPEGIPMTRSRATMTMTAATALPAIFRALMANFQTGQTAFGWARPHAGVALSPSLSRKGETAQSRQK
jgi:hypothetical protein